MLISEMHSVLQLKLLYNLFDKWKLLTDYDIQQLF